MKQLKNSILMLFIFIFCVCSNPVLASNTNVNINDVKTDAPSCILIDVKSDKILYSKNAYDKMYPASTTKLMTAILALEKCKLNDVLTVSHNAIYSIPVGYSHASLKEGEKLTVEQLLNILLIPSANDAAIVLAEHISGSVDEFSKLMNAKAKEIGCKSTNFVNPNGIHNKNHYSTAYDLSLIGKYSMKFADIMRISMVRQYTLPTTNKYDKKDRIFNATNALINNESLNKNYYPYATGLKTGYTDTAGSCIVATSKKGDRELLLVILNAKSADSRYNDCKKLFDYGFEHYSYTTLNSIGDVIEEKEFTNATPENKTLKIVVKDDIKVLLKNNVNKNNIKPKIEINPDLVVPISKNTVVGKISYDIDGSVYSSDLIADSSVYNSNFEVILFRVLLIFLILYIIYRLLKSTSNNDKTDDWSNYSPKNDKKKNKKSKKIKNFDNHFRSGKGNFKFTQIDDYL